MTNEEAIADIRDNIKPVVGGISLDMAIQALEQQPCDDWYDVPSNEMTLEQARQAVKDLRKKLAEYLEQQPCEDCVSRQAVHSLMAMLLSDYLYDEDREKIELIDAEIAELPSVTPKEKTGWIPVSERLPEDKTYVLTTIKVPNRIAHARSGWYDGGFFMNDNGDTWRATDIEVIAWMPLPEPYKAESE